MKFCNKCHTEYPDDMVFCTRCGITLQSKTQEHVCPACGKVLGKDTLQFCPYCGYELTSPNTSKIDSDNKVCPSCGKVIYAKNLDVCPYCDNKLSVKATNVKKPILPEVNIKKNYVKMQPLNQEKSPTTTPLESNVQGNVCPACGKVIHAKNINSCPYCGRSLNDRSCSYNNQTPASVKKPLPPEANIKKNYVKMQPLNHTDNEKNANITSNDKNNEKEVKEKSGSILGTIVELVLLIVGTLFAKSCAHALIRSSYRGPTVIISLLLTVAFAVYILYQVVCYFKKK